MNGFIELVTSKGWAAFFLAFSIMFAIIDFATGEWGWGIFMALCALYWGYTYFTHDQKYGNRNSRRYY